MKIKLIRDWMFYSHRVIGLVVGLVFVITGLTGTVLVFQREIVEAQTVAQYGQVVPQGPMLAPEAIVDIVRSAYANQPQLKLTSVLHKPEATAPYRATFKGPDDHMTSVLINPYDGKIMGSFLNHNTWTSVTFRLHYALLAGDNGKVVMGTVAGLAFLLCITGIALWSGWRKLSTGFRIKWNASTVRTSYDVHNVYGIVVAVFLSFTAFTGFIWNFDLNPVVYAVTGTVNNGVAKSKPIDRPPIRDLTSILTVADAALPGAETTQISFPQKPTDAYRIRKKFPQEDWHFGRSLVFVDQFTGEVIQVKDGLQPNLGDRILASFTPLHYGTFWGLSSRILYLFVGLSPLVLFVTGFILWWKRRKPRVKRNDRVAEINN